jgi:uracil-DNA glycosylase
VKTLLVGQAPSGHPSDPDVPLGGRCGARLADLCGLSLEAYLDRFERTNLLPVFPGKNGKGDSFPLAPARAAAAKIVKAHDGMGCRIIFLTSVASAILPALSWGSSLKFKRYCGSFYAWCPHPSGVNRWWNDPANVERARAFWTELARQIS